MMSRTGMSRGALHMPDGLDRCYATLSVSCTDRSILRRRSNLQHQTNNALLSSQTRARMAETQTFGVAV